MTLSINDIISDYEGFRDRICKENLWSAEYTNEVIHEYVKFIQLGTMIDVAPSKEIDIVWHTHLLYTKDYLKMCKALNIGFFHHNPKPSKILPGVIAKDEYEETKLLYETVFGYKPRKDIWTDWKPSDYINIDLKSHWVIPEGDWKALIKLFFKYIKSRI